MANHLHPEPSCHYTEIMYEKEIDNEDMTLCQVK